MRNSNSSGSRGVCGNKTLRTQKLMKMIKSHKIIKCMLHFANIRSHARKYFRYCNIILDSLFVRPDINYFHYNRVKRSIVTQPKVCVQYTTPNVYNTKFPTASLQVITIMQFVSLGYCYRDKSIQRYNNRRKTRYSKNYARTNVSPRLDQLKVQSMHEYHIKPGSLLIYSRVGMIDNKKKTVAAHSKYVNK